ncbi:hypothetical protein ASD45_00970 [Pseudolabrys sp. Root1462]|uniref:hypothetical protein n=1 Tax=Pseudolabrys sp. Root1462 TaxID=1736466 RepID=UPI00070353B2|nr:hypothetical protein [Pseudolabrys sp. Root1462]KQY99526.1 hypothetical protein ASD45_00970 [Pseudolabrys sp. Root1462]
MPLPEPGAGAQVPAALPSAPPAASQGPPLPVNMQPVPPAIAPAAIPPPSAPSAAPPLVTAEPDRNRLNIIRSAPEQIGETPSQFMWIRDGLMAARDPLDGMLVFFGDDGRVLGRAKLPDGFDTEDIVSLPTAIRLIDSSHRTQITIQRTIDPATTTLLQSTPNSSDSTVRARRLTRRGPQELIVNDERQNGSRPLTVRSLTGARLAQAYEISPGTNDNRYVATEEITAVKPALTVRVVVQRFDKDGKLTGIAYVPLDSFEPVSRNFIAITGGGLLRALRPTADGVKIDEYDFVAPPRVGNRRLNDSELKSLSRKVREIAVDANVQGDSSTPFNDGGPHLDLAIPSPPKITRAQVLENARAFLTVDWVMRRENFSRPGIVNRCDPARSYVWQRPHHFTEDMIGTTIGPMPYRWGGEDTPQSFRTRTGWGALAGSICTCRQAQYNYCIFADSAGVDCSGFVSRAWGIEKRGTSGLLDVATDVESLEALKPGDAFDWPQRHVRLFIGLVEGPAISFNTLESSTRSQCEGVCERAYRPSELNGFRLIRFKNIIDNGVVASTGQNGGAKPDGPAAAPAQSTEVTAATTIANNGSATTAKRRAVNPPRRAVPRVHVTQRRAQWR